MKNDIFQQQSVIDFSGCANWMDRYNFRRPPSLDSGILAGKRDRFLIGSLLENSKDNDQYPPKEVPFPMTTVTTVNF